MSAPGPLRAAEATRDDWETPRELFAILNSEMEFSLDGAATPENAKCFPFFSPEKDAFAQTPVDERIWLNPPYGRDLPRWIDLAKSWSTKNTVVLLLPNATDTRWFEHVANFPGAREIRLLVPRVMFIHAPHCTCKGCASGDNSSNTGGNIIVVMGPGERPTHIWTWRWKA